MPDVADWGALKKLVGLEPMFAAGTVQAVLGLVLACGVHLSDAVTGGIEAVAVGALALVAAIGVDEVTPVLFTGLLSAVGTLAIPSACRTSLAAWCRQRTAS